MMTFGSLFSGVGGFDLGLERAGMKCKWQSEIDAAALSVLARHWPGVPNIGDIRNVTEDTAEPVDLICGGFPCQDLSVAGRRAGLAGERSGLWFEFARVIDELEPRWVVIENVPGLLSSNRGRDFAIIIRWLAERGYGVAWRVLDSQYFGVAQRRKRMFIVASFGNGRCGQVLFEREGGCWNSAPRREERQEVAGTTAYSVTFCDTGGKRKDRPNGGLYINKTDKSNTMLSSGDSGILVMAHGQANAEIVNDGEPSLTLNHEQPIVIGSLQARDFKGVVNQYVNENKLVWHNKQSAGEIRMQNDISPTMSRAWGAGGNNVPFVGVRRLTPLECERLQGFPDGWTAGQSDSARYRQLGNAVTVNVIEWLGRQIIEANQ